MTEKPFSTDFIVRSNVVLLRHFPRKMEGLDPTTMFYPVTFYMYVSVPSQEHVIQWLSFFVVNKTEFDAIVIQVRGLAL